MRDARQQWAGVTVLLFAISANPSVQQGSAPREEEVTFTNGDVKLAGTLTLPRGDGPFPAVVLLTGSGPQNRDEEIFGFRLFKVIADHLAQHAVAVLRYDDRGVGGSSGSVTHSTTEDFAGDALKAIEFLAARREVQPARIGLLGHSEGALAGAIAAAGSDTVAFLVLLAGSALPGDEVLRGQAVAMARAGGAEEALVEKILSAHRRLTAAVRANAPEAELRDGIRAVARAQIEAAPEAQRKMIANPEAFIDTLIDRQVAALQTKWMRFFIGFDPAVPLARLSCPVLAIFGEKDVQVPPDTNLPALEAALRKAANRDVTVKTYPDANHLFRPAVTGLPMEYATLEKRVVPGLLDDVARWINGRAR